MARLKYKTRGMISPQGKPKVYFCCHPKDFPKYFEKISEEILSKQNCSIWYDSEPESAYDEEFYMDLEQMQLFVMPVTRKLLCEKNRVLDAIFLFALERHIPVLPLMQESNLETLFNSKCGDLQFLDKNNQDSTARNFDEKLEKYLSSVLIGDELAEKIRAAFDAYIFLSYRKKDRAYAQELMRLIHKNDFCRDIAIWYDEFLIPGENFNDSIKEALEKSELFIMTVTPNLVNETNYIMTTEYPEARQENKLILPAELIPTDRKELEEKYADIPTCTDAYDSLALSQALSDAIARMAMKEKDNSLEHHFFIGLAYLGGVDVEVDYERALKLITSSADAGLPEAAEKLVSMYQNGEGVARDYRRAIEWQRKLAIIYEGQYKITGKEEDADRWLLTLKFLGDYIFDMYQMEEAKDVYRQMLYACESVMEVWNTPRIRRYLSVSYRKLGNVCYLEKNVSEAKGYYEKALAVSEELEKEIGTAEIQRNLSLSYERLGDLSRIAGKLPEARMYCSKYLALCEELVKKTGTTESRRDLSIGYGRLGNISFLERKLPEARMYYEKALAISEELVKETETAQSKRDLSINYERLGDLSRIEGNLLEARMYYGKSLVIREQLAEDTKTITIRRDLASNYEKLGSICYSEEQWSEAKGYYKKILAISEELTQEVETIEMRQKLSKSYEMLGDLSCFEGKLTDAKLYFEKKLLISKALVEEKRTTQTYQDLALAYHKLGFLTESKEFFKMAYDIWVSLAQEDANKTGYVKLIETCKRQMEKLN